MFDIEEELKKYGLTKETYEECLLDIEGKINGEQDLEWQDIVEKYNLPVHRDTLRKASNTIFGGTFTAQYHREKNVIKESPNEYLRALKEEQIQIRMATQELRDERQDFQRQVRENARRESFIQLVKRAMEQTIRATPYNASPLIESDNDMIVCLSDIHAGIEVANSFNTFNMTELNNRLQKYLDEIIGIQNTHRCKNCYLVLGGDLISGLIHRNLRLQNNENVIEQVKSVSVQIGAFIAELVKHFEQIHVFSVSGNHSRLSPSKEDQLKGEELDALVPFYLEIMFRNYKNIEFCKNAIDDTILNFKTRGGHLFYGVHGDKDTPTNAVKTLTLITGEKPAGIIIGHRHHNALDTQYGVKVIQCGCVSGTDDYGIDHRMMARPEQCVVITNKKNPVRCFYDIGLS